MTEFDFRTAALVFFAYFVIDVMYALYVIAVGKKRAFSAAVMTSAICVINALGVMTYSRNSMYILPLAAGAFLGTYAAVKLKV